MIPIPLCRVCLSTKVSLHIMHEYTLEYFLDMCHLPDTEKNIIYLTGEYRCCTDCEASMSSSLAFRNKCRNAFNILQDWKRDTAKLPLELLHDILQEAATTPGGTLEQYSKLYGYEDPYQLNPDEKKYFPTPPKTISLLFLRKIDKEDAIDGKQNNSQEISSEVGSETSANLQTAPKTGYARIFTQILEKKSSNDKKHNNSKAIITSVVRNETTGNIETSSKTASIRILTKLVKKKIDINKKITNSKAIINSEVGSETAKNLQNSPKPGNVGILSQLLEKKSVNDEKHNNSKDVITLEVESENTVHYKTTPKIDSQAIISKKPEHNYSRALTSEIENKQNNSKPIITSEVESETTGNIQMSSITDSVGQIHEINSEIDEKHSNSSEIESETSELLETKAIRPEGVFLYIPNDNSKYPEVESESEEIKTEIKEEMDEVFEIIQNNLVLSNNPESSNVFVNHEVSNHVEVRSEPLDTPEVSSHFELGNHNLFEVSNELFNNEVGNTIEVKEEEEIDYSDTVCINDDDDDESDDDDTLLSELGTKLVRHGNSIYIPGKPTKPKEDSLMPQYVKIFDIQVFNTDEQARADVVARRASFHYLCAQHRCDQCCLVFRNETCLITHMKCHDPSLAYRCQVCQMGFPTHKLRTEHKNNNHRHRFACKMCPEIIYSMTTMKKHYNKHTRELLTTETAARSKQPRPAVRKKRKAEE